MPPAGRRRLPTTGQVFAVVDAPEHAPGIITELTSAGIEANAVTLLRGTEGAARIDPTGVGSGIRERLRKAMSFMLVDQMPDFIVYEAALLDGRSVLAVAVPTEATKHTVARILRAGGAHFVNHYGRFATEELDAWRGPELPIPAFLRR